MEWQNVAYTGRPYTLITCSPPCSQTGAHLQLRDGAQPGLSTAALPSGCLLPQTAIRWQGEDVSTAAKQEGRK